MLYIDNERDSVFLVFIVNIACGKNEAVVNDAAIYPIISGVVNMVFLFEEIFKQKAILIRPAITRYNRRATKD